MKSTLSRIVSIALLLVLFIPHFTSAETKTFVREYNYHAGDEDSKNSSRTISLREVKRLLLEELGTYLESTTEVQNFKLTKDQIITLTAGIVQTELVEEKWDGRNYWLKAKIQADSGDVIKAIDALRKDRQKTKELEEVRKKSDALLKENERLRQELATAKGEKKKKETEAYNKTIQDLKATEWFEIGYQFGIADRLKEALDAFTKAIEINPQFAQAYSNRGFAYSNLGDYNQAIKDYNRAIEINPQDAVAYYNRGGLAYGKLGNYNQAIKDYNKAIEINPQLAGPYYNRGNVYVIKLGNNNRAIKDYNKAIELNPQFAQAYYNRGVAYGNLGNYKQAIADYNRAIELNPQFAKAYYNRGLAYGKLGNYNQEIKDYSRAIELNPQFAKAYYNRGFTYNEIGNYKQAVADIKIAARLGHEMAQELLRKNGIAW